MVYTLRQLSTNDTQVLVAAPERGTSMDEFLAKAEAHFTIEKDFCPVFDRVIEKQVKPVFEERLGKKIEVIDYL